MDSSKPERANRANPSWRGQGGIVDPLDFAPALLRMQEQPPAPLAGWYLRLLLGLFVFVLLWAALGRLDIVAVAEGKLVPEGYLKIVQPSEQGIVRDILVR